MVVSCQIQEQEVVEGSYPRDESSIFHKENPRCKASRFQSKTRWKLSWWRQSGIKTRVHFGKKRSPLLFTRGRLPVKMLFRRESIPDTFQLKYFETIQGLRPHFLKRLLIGTVVSFRRERTFMEDIRYDFSILQSRLFTEDRRGVLGIVREQCFPVGNQHSLLYQPA